MKNVPFPWPSLLCDEEENLNLNFGAKMNQRSTSVSIDGADSLIEYRIHRKKGAVNLFNYLLVIEVTTRLSYANSDNDKRALWMM